MSKKIVECEQKQSELSMQVRVFQEVQPDCDREKLRTGAQRMPGKGWAKVEEGGQWGARGPWKGRLRDLVFLLNSVFGDLFLQRLTLRVAWADTEPTHLSTSGVSSHPAGLPGRLSREPQDRIGVFKRPPCLLNR